MWILIALSIFEINIKYSSVRQIDSSHESTPQEYAYRNYLLKKNTQNL